MEVSSHNLQTVVAPMAVGRLRQLSTVALEQCGLVLIRQAFHPHTNSQN